MSDEGTFTYKRKSLEIVCTLFVWAQMIHFGFSLRIRLWLVFHIKDISAGNMEQAVPKVAIEKWQN